MEREIARIDSVIASLTAGPVSAAPRVPIATSILQAVMQATGPITTDDVLNAARAAGAVFQTPDPLAGTRAALYKLKKTGKITSPAKSLWARVG